MKIQTEVLRSIWRNKEDSTVEDIINDTKLTRKQILAAIFNLHRRDLIKREYDYINEGKVTQGYPPIKKVKAKPNLRVVKRIKKVLENGR